MQKRKLLEYFTIIAGSCCLSLGLAVFLAPSRMGAGGVSSIGTLLLYFLKIPMSVTTLVINGILFLAGYKFLGRPSVFKTLLGILFFSLSLTFFETLAPFREDRVAAALFGGVLVGLGTGLVVRVEASTGGSDFAALILHRFFPHISVPLFIMGIDCAIIAISGILFKSLTVTVYSIGVLFISMKTADVVLAFGDAAKSIYILSEKAEEIAGAIQAEFARGITGVYSRGMYTGEKMLMLLSVVSPKQLPSLLHLVRQKDPAAFIIVSDVREVVGEGFKSGAVYDSIRKK